MKNKNVREYLLEKQASLLGGVTRGLKSSMKMEKTRMGLKSTRLGSGVSNKARGLVAKGQLGSKSLKVPINAQRAKSLLNPRTTKMRPGETVTRKVTKFKTPKAYVPQGSKAGKYRPVRAQGPLQPYTVQQQYKVGPKGNLIRYGLPQSAKQQAIKATKGI